LKIEDLSTDLADGLCLLSLLEQISGKTVSPVYNKNPKIRVQKIENVNFSLEFLKVEGIKLVGVGGGDIVDGNLKLILGLIWTIILRYQIQVAEGNSARAELLEWVRARIPEYNINNFANDWSSGRAICALAEAVQPGQMNLPHDFTSDAIYNANMGMQKSEENMNIPQILDAEDMANAPDELANMTYISYFRDYWTSMMEKMAWPEACTFLSFTAHVQSATRNGQIKTTGGDRFIASIAGPGGEVPSQVLDNGNGTYNVSYQLPGSGQYTVSVKVQGKDIRGSPFQQIVS
jgi:filamin